MTNKAPEPLPVSVIIPTFRRPEALTACVRSLLAGSVLPDEIIVVVRDGDEETCRAVTRLPAFGECSVPLRADRVSQAGHLPPIEAGLRLAGGQVVAILDDDVTVDRDWLRTLLGDFGDSTVGVVGGRVVVPGQPLGRLRGKPGHVTWYGRTWGNVASREDRRVMEVDAVMECNWAWRTELLRNVRIDPRLNFDDSAMYGLDLCWQAKERGYRVLYEPRALVLHHMKPRTPELDRANRPPRAYGYCRNYTYILLKHAPAWRRLIFLAWWFGIGERAACGLGAWAAETLSGHPHSREELERVFAGKIEGIRLWLRERRTAPEGARRTSR